MEEHDFSTKSTTDSDINDMVTIIPKFAMVPFDYLASMNDSKELVLGIFGIFLCFFGMKFKVFSQTTIIGLLIFLLLQKHSSKIEKVTRIIDFLMRKILPSKILVNFPIDNNNTIGLFTLAAMLTFLLFFVLSWLSCCSFIFSIFSIFALLEPIYNINFPEYSNLLSSICAIVFTILIFYFKSHALSLLTNLMICSVGVGIIFLLFYKRFNMFKSFRGLYANMVHFNLKVFEDPLFYIFIPFVLICFLIQTTYKK